MYRLGPIAVLLLVAGQGCGRQTALPGRGCPCAERLGYRCCSSIDVCVHESVACPADAGAPPDGASNDTSVSPPADSVASEAGPGSSDSGKDVPVQPPPDSGGNDASMRPDGGAPPVDALGLVLWNKLGSVGEVERSEVGPNGTHLGGSFVAGKFGGAYSAQYDQDFLVSFPRDVIPIQQGTIEFWGKLLTHAPALTAGQNPTFVQAEDGMSSFTVDLNANDGAGNGGLCGLAGRSFYAGTGLFGDWTYTQVLGVGAEQEWHHYALVWKAGGIGGVGTGKRQVAVFLDGVLNSTHFCTRSPSEPTCSEESAATSSSSFVPLTSGRLGLIGYQGTTGSAAIDNLKIWSFAKTNFSDRFVED